MAKIGGLTHSTRRRLSYKKKWTTKQSLNNTWRTRVRAQAISTIAQKRCRALRCQNWGNRSSQNKLCLRYLLGPQHLVASLLAPFIIWQAFMDPCIISPSSKRPSPQKRAVFLATWLCQIWRTAKKWFINPNLKVPIKKSSKWRIKVRPRKFWRS